MSLLTPNEAQRAIYIDFEGNTDIKPTLLGILYAPDPDEHTPFPADVLEQWILEPAFHGSVEGSKSPTGAVDLLPFALKLIDRAKREKRRIVSWSHHDLDLIMDALGPRKKAKRTLEVLYRDAKRAGEAWSHSWPLAERPAVHALTHYLQRVGYEVPAPFGTGRTGDSLRDIRKSLETHLHNWQRLTTRKRERFYAFLMHNRHDLLGMRAVAKQATAYLHGRGTRELLNFLEGVGMCTKPFCTTCGSLARKGDSLKQFVAGGNLRVMLPGITTRDLRRQSINVDWLVELIHQLPKASVRVVLRAWATAGVLSRLDLTMKLVSDERVFRLAPRNVRSELRNALREEALQPSARHTRRILFEHFDKELAPDDPVRIAYTEEMAETKVISGASYDSCSANEARLADMRIRATALTELS